jgi:hypothetical protein
MLTLSIARMRATAHTHTMRVADRTHTGDIGHETGSEHNLVAYDTSLYSSEYWRFLAVDKLLGRRLCKFTSLRWLRPHYRNVVDYRPFGDR